MFASLARGTTVGWAWLTLVQGALQVASLPFLFTPSAREWLDQP